ncbi:hypothetical protein PAECIP111802_06919 [Paenibacillus allorhizosphaerae]|uniref:Uncharacterized protein n=1 Tax=Paenibacillus allorhizosphaerae TaxID=2849866 RepID=A0ABN7TW18_9BACL|nr:hypothetical protein PAECIP111802_06919 [Paenibacillus allorhizosphaerae]
MTPFAAKILILLGSVFLYIIMKQVFRNTLKGEQTVPYLLFIFFTPYIAFAGVLLFLYLVKSITYFFMD